MKRRSDNYKGRTKCYVTNAKEKIAKKPDYF